MADGLVADANIFRVSVQMRLLEQQLQIGWHLRDVGIGNQSPADAVEAAKAWVDTNLIADMANAVKFERIEAVHLTNKTYAQHEYVNTTGAINTTVGNGVTAAIFALRTATRKRYENGRFFYPIPGQVNVTNGKITDAKMTTLIAHAADFADRFTGSSLSHDFKACIVSRPRPLTSNRPAVEHAYTDVVAVKVQAIPSFLGRRNIGHGA